MKRKSKVKFDEIGYWSEIKLDIIERYAAEYSKILTAQRNFSHVYIDAFAGAGVHISKTSQEPVLGSPLKALYVQPPFREFYYIDLDGEKVDTLKRLVGERADVHIYLGDCNDILLKDVFPKVQYEQYRRGLCLLDPYGLHLNWEVMETAGKMKSIDMFLNFPIMDMNRNTLWKNPDRVDSGAVARMNAFWGDDSWRNIAYATDRNLFGLPEKEDNETIAEGFRKRLQIVAGFKHVPKPIPMRNLQGAVVYYLFFASQKSVANNIVEYIFDKYRSRGMK
jgi:three-Cys-motif partner protein